MRIGELAVQTGVSTKTIRYYEQIGLVPDTERAANGYRVYDDSAVERIGFVRDAQATGLRLAEIREVLQLRDEGLGTCHHVTELLTDHLVDIEARIKSLRQTRRELAVLIKRAGSLDPEGCTDPNRCQVIARRGKR